MRRTSVLGVGLLAVAAAVHASGLHQLAWWGWTCVGVASAVAIGADVATELYRRRTLSQAHG